MRDGSASAPTATGRSPRQGHRRLRCSRWAAAVLALLLGLPAADAAVLTVTTLEDVDASEGECSLREAIVAANTDADYRECPAGAGADEIEIEIGGALVLATDLEPITEALTLRGLGVDVSTLDGAGLFSLLHFTDAAAGNGELLRVEQLRLTGGAATDGGSIFVGRNRSLHVEDAVLEGNSASLDGGAVFGDRPTSITVVRTWVTGNSAGGAGGGIAAEFAGTLHVEDSTLSGNTAASGAGGAIYTLALDEVVLQQSTLSGNMATGDGGGIAAVVTPLRVELSTLTANVADSDDDGQGDGGGMSVAGGGALGTWVGSIVAGNTDASTAAAAPRCPDGNRKLGAALASEGFNLLGANDCVEGTFPAGTPNLNGDQVGTSLASIDPVLGTLAANGGATATHLPLEGSPAIDQGNCPLEVADQRGFASLATASRAVDSPTIPNLSDGCDIGSVETGAVDLAGLVFFDGFETGDTAGWILTVP